MDDKSYVVVTSMGTDRPGIVEELSGWILEQGGNIEDSRMSRLGGEFAALILVSGAPGLDQRLADTRTHFQDKRHLAVLTKAVAGAPAAPRTAMLRYHLRAASLDHPGILHQVAQLLRAHAISIASASTRTAPAPFTGVAVFQFQMEIDVPADVAISQLRTELHELASRQNIDFTLSAAAGEVS